MLDQIKIASPCSADWEQMAGDDRVRFCAECKKNVFNLSAMTRRDAEALLQKTNGDLCTRLYRRADGTVLTADCPVGLRVKIARIQRRVGWAVAGAFSIATACAQDKPPALSGTVDDTTLAGIGNSRVTARNLRSNKETQVATDRMGEFRFDELEPGMYNVTASATGFAEGTAKYVDLREGGRKVQIVLQVARSDMGGPIVAVQQSKPKPWWRRLL